MSKTEKEQNIDNYSFTKITDSLKDFEPITLERARQCTSLKRWKAYVYQYQMLGGSNLWLPPPKQAAVLGF